MSENDRSFWSGGAIGDITESANSEGGNPTCQTHQTFHLKRVIQTVCKLYLTKPDLQKKKNSLHLHLTNNQIYHYVIELKLPLNIYINLTLIAIGHSVYVYSIL